MKVRVIKEYYDLELKKTVKVDEEFTVSEARGKALTTKNNKACCVLCKVVEEAEKVAEEKPKKKRATKKADQE